MSAKPRTLLVIGSGPGNGIHVAIAFGKRDFSNIILLSRNEERLERDKQQLIGSIGNRDVNVTTQQVDITNDTMLRSVLAHIVDSTTVDCVYFNAARVEPSEMFDFPVEEIRRDFDTTVIALYTTASLFVPKMLSQASEGTNPKPAFLVTNSLLYRNPFAPFFSLSAVKSAQRTLVQCLAQSYQAQGIHFGLISVEEPVSMDNTYSNPPLIAERAWELYSQTQDKWTLEVEVLGRK